MRWWSPDRYGFGVRERSGFLWWPVTIDGETRWLERAVWREVREARNDVHGGEFRMWSRAEWIDSPGPRRAAAADFSQATLDEIALAVRRFRDELCGS